ncbi:hypothetical protein XENTR_v10004758 [Xenopus tropicalis]|uniref:LOC100127716 protein n=1 Tax=Xenopus tropicalis TaxID=8364 RepID=A8WGX7_XENTR|eukprot:NP_001106521.1 uncharacterized protein LOC100127716 precursor [Xenopus tropicalis]
MVFLQATRFVLCLILFIPANVVAAGHASADATEKPETGSHPILVSVPRGETAVMECKYKVPTGETFIMITWKFHRSDQSHCIYSNKRNQTFNNCSSRIEFNSSSLRIYNATETDDGTYRCEVVTADGTFFHNVVLQVVVKPSVTLISNRHGFPECRAHGGNPAANISWIPEGSISTNRAMEPDRSWIVSSTYTATSSNVTQVTCIVSHPTFAQPQNYSISIAPYKGSTYILLLTIPLVVLVILIIVGFLFFWTMSQRLRACLSKEIKNTTVTPQDTNEQNKEEVEPYASYTQKINTIYNSISEI